MTQPKYPTLQSAVLSFKILERSTPPAKPSSQPVRSQCCRQCFHTKSNIKWLTKEDKSSLTTVSPLLRTVSFSGFKCSAQPTLSTANICLWAVHLPTTCCGVHSCALYHHTLLWVAFPLVARNP